MWDKIANQVAGGTVTGVIGFGVVTTGTHPYRAFDQQPVGDVETPQPYQWFWYERESAEQEWTKRERIVALPPRVLQAAATAPAAKRAAIVEAVRTVPDEQLEAALAGILEAA
jgi:hypothetical protein